jgi:hypothetical protein
MWHRYRWNDQTAQYDLFDTDECDHCGHDIQAANSVGTSEPEKKLKLLGMKKYPGDLPDEGSLIEETEDVVCNDCYDKYVRKEIGV